MTTESQERTYPIEEALRAQKALRQMAGLGQEQFPLSAFIGMVSDEIEILRGKGLSDHQIAEAISRNSRIAVTANDIASNYASPEARHPHGHGV